MSWVRFRVGVRTLALCVRSHRVSSLGRALFCPRVFCCGAQLVFSLAVCVNTWFMSCLIGCVCEHVVHELSHWLCVWTRGLWVVSLAVCVNTWFMSCLIGCVCEHVVYELSHWLCVWTRGLWVVSLAVCVNTWFMSCLIGCVCEHVVHELSHWLCVWTRGLWVVSLAVCLCLVLHMAGDLFAGHVLVFVFCVSTWLLSKFSVCHVLSCQLSWPHPSCYLIIG